MGFRWIKLICALASLISYANKAARFIKEVNVIVDLGQMGEVIEIEQPMLTTRDMSNWVLE